MTDAIAAIMASALMANRRRSHIADYDREPYRKPSPRKPATPNKRAKIKAARKQRQKT